MKTTLHPQKKPSKKKKNFLLKEKQNFLKKKPIKKKTLGKKTSKKKKTFNKKCFEKETTPMENFFWRKSPFEKKQILFKKNNLSKKKTLKKKTKTQFVVKKTVNNTKLNLLWNRETNPRQTHLKKEKNFFQKQKQSLEEKTSFENKPMKKQIKKKL